MVFQKIWPFNKSKINCQPHLNLGQTAEDAAKSYLLSQKLKLVACNFRFRLGEIDLIFTDGNTLIFVEVRARQSDAYGSAVESVSLSKQKRIIKTANYFLLKHPRYKNHACRFDIIGVKSYNSGFNFDWQKNAFQAPNQIF